MAVLSINVCFILQYDNQQSVALFLDKLENRGVRDWYLLGICIELPKFQLDKIERNALESSRRVLDTVYHWLTKDPKQLPSFDELNKQCDCVNNPDKMTSVKFDHRHPERYLPELEKNVSTI